MLQTEKRGVVQMHVEKGRAIYVMGQESSGRQSPHITGLVKELNVRYGRHGVFEANAAEKSGAQFRRIGGTRHDISVTLAQLASLAFNILLRLIIKTSSHSSFLSYQP